MENIDTRCRGLVRVAAIALLGGMAAACSSGVPPQPAPVIIGNDYNHPAAMAQGEPDFAPPPRQAMATAWREPSRPRLAEAERIPASVIIAANHLRPPYRLEPGSVVLIPPRQRWASLERPAELPLDRPSGAVSRDRPPLASADPNEPRPMRAPAPRQEAAVIPLDPGPAAANQRMAEAVPSEPAQMRDERSERAASRHAGRFPWPVQGHILARYGRTAGGGHNDGINIAAPRGAAVHAIAPGVVAYAGNELRSYGNLVLLKQSDGFISAYAHCEKLLVKQGQHVKPGQIIALVGATGSVKEPQLHFELRRGEHAVDPAEFLRPPPSAAGPAASRDG